ncbi:ankyrin [Tricholoma matsutake]|nr:ankyrin [Tricholoma matsutake 945]
MSSLSVHSAVHNNQLSLLRALITEDPNLINALDMDDRTPLHWAASSGSINIAQLLIDHKAEVDRSDNSGWTPLHIAVSAGNDDIVQELRQQKEFQRNYPSIGRLLISRGADINAKDKANQVPLHRAATTGSVGFIRLLLDSSSSTSKLRLNPGDRMGNTPMHLAMDSAHAEAAVVLINAGADRGRVNLDNETPEDVPGVGGSEQKHARQHVIDSCGKPR